MNKTMRNQIVLVPFPHDDFKDFKIRPVLCLTDSIGHFEHIIVAFITSQVNTILISSDVQILDSDTDFLMTGLKTDSIIRLHRITSIPKSSIKRHLGELPIQYQTVVNIKLKLLFDLM
jgi:mRNA interferase MazF